MGLQAQTKADSSRVLEVRTLVTLGMGLHRAITILKKYPFCSCLYVYPPSPKSFKNRFSWLLGAHKGKLCVRGCDPGDREDKPPTRRARSGSAF